MTECETQAIPVLSLLFVINDWDKAVDLDKMLENDGVFLFFQFRAHGTARSEMLHILGLDSSDKAVTVCVVPEDAGLTLMADAARRLKMAVSGNGIAFLAPLSGVSKMSSIILREERLKNISEKTERDAKRMDTNHTHDLILAIINQGFSEELMEAAREAGATGGTVIHARQLGSALPEKFAGIKLGEEKEIVLVLAEKGEKLTIMGAVNKRCGLASAAQGLIISLPVDAVMGV
ncbi:MAG: hypothetical protein LBS19_16295 [Clostridiales bacterium]|jgi:hypothetical protein|nr:hypothetical protein [Clostridiales bacterium]